MKGSYSSLLASKTYRRAICLFVALSTLLLTSQTIQAACTTPTGLSVSNLSTNAATLLWTQSDPGTQTNYDYAVSSNPITDADWSSLSATTEGVVAYGNAQTLDLTQLSLTGLQPGTTYYVLLRQNCEWDYADASGWVNTSFSTMCTPVALPLDTMKFASSAIPSCWMTAGGILPVLQTSYRYGSDGYAVKLQNSTTANSLLISPAIQGATSASEIVFRAYSTSTVGKQRFVVGVADINSDITTEMVPIYEDSTVAGQWIEFVASDNTAMFSNGYVYIIYAEAGNSSTFYVDNVIIRNVTTCKRPSNLTVSGATANSATFAWTENGTATAWVLELTPKGGTALTIPAASNPFTYSSLQANTQYTVRVKADCGTEESEYCAVSASFKTQCGEVAVPYSNDFESYSSGDIPDCFTAHYEGSSSATVYTYPNNYLRLNQYANTSPVYAVLPKFDTSIDLLRATFKYRYENVSKGWLEIGYMTDNSNVSTFVVLDTLPRTTTFTSKVVFFDAVPSTASYIAFRFSGVTYSYYYGDIDDLVVDLAPTCKSPTDLVMASYGSDKAVFTWKQSSSVSKWEVKWTNGTDSGTEIINTTPSFTLSGLTEQTVYAPAIQVRAICQEGDTSEVLSSSFSFKTKCATIAIPYYNSFEESTSAIPSCWDNSQVKGSYKWTPSTSGYNNTNGLSYQVPYSSSDYSGNYNLLMTPTLSLTENARFSFRYRNTDSDQARLDILLYVDDGLTVVTDTLDSVLTASVWTKKEYDLSAYTGKQVVVVFAATVLSNDDYSSYVYLDDVEIEPLSTCPKPEKAWIGDITATTANVYVQGGDGTIMVEYGEGLTASAAKSTTDTTVVPLSGLAKMTTYKVVAYAACDATHESRKLDTLTFQTDQDPAAIPYATTGFSDWILKNGDQTNYWKVVDDSLCIVYKNTSGTEVKGYQIKPATYNDPSVSSNVYATRSFTIEEEGMYTFSFKWRAQGESTYDYMLALVAPVNEVIEAGRDINSSFPATWTKLGSAERLNLQTALQNFEADLNMVPGTYRVMLYWRNDNSGGTQPAAIVSDFSIHQQMCAYPNTPTVTDLSYNSVSLSWNATGADTYSLKVFEGTSIQTDIDTTTVAFEIVDTDLTTVSFTGLQSQKDYVAVVQSNCGVSGVSKWSDAVSFKTLCAPKTLPYTEGFETSNTEFDCWTKVKADGGSYYIGTYTVRSGSKALYGMKTTFTTMELSFDEGKNLSNYLITGYAKPYADSLKFTIGIQKTLADATSYQLVTTVLLPSEDDWTEFSQSFAPLAVLPDAADYKYIVINFDADQNIYLDDITIEEIPSCPKVASISVEDVTASSASVDWLPNGTETQWEVCLKSGDNTVKTQVVTAHPHSYIDLQSNTAYTVQIRAICGVGDTSEVRTASFKTLCSTASMPFFEDFNSLTSGIPDCWDNTEGTTTTASHRWNYYATGYESTPCVMFNSYSNYSPNTNFLKTVPVQITEAARVSFSYLKQKSSYSSTTSGLDVYISIDGGVSYTDTLAKDIPATGSSFVDTVINLDTRFIGKDITLVFKGTSNFGSYNVFLDNVKIEAIPSCELSKTLEVKVSDVTTTTAKLTVSDAQQTNLQWEYIYGKQGFDIASATPITPTSDAVVLEGLDSNTKYMIYVRHYCSTTDVSTWHSGTSFKTAASLPYAEDFNSLTTGIPEGWDNTEGTTTYSSHRWSYNSNGYESTPCLRFNCFSNYTGNTNFLKSEPVYITEDARVSFVYKKLAASGLDVYISIDGGATYADTLAESLPASNGEFVEFIENLDSRFTGQTIVLVWKGTSNYGSSSDNDHIFLDNVKIEVAPDCDTPKGVNLLERSTDAAKLVVVRRDGQAECTYEYALVEAGGNVDEATVVACPVSDTIVLSALQPQTDYELYVRTVCGEDSRSLWSDAKAFTTLCVQQSVPYSENFGTTTISQYDNVLLPSCWIVLNGVDEITSSNDKYTSYVRIVDETTLNTSWSTVYYGVTGDYLLFNAYSTTSQGKILYAVMPEFSAKLDRLQVSFTTAFESTSATDTLTLGYMTNIADDNSFVPVVNIPKSKSNVTHTIVLGTYDVPSIYAPLALRYKVNSYYYRVGVDNLSVTVVDYPTGLKATDITQTSATMSWNDYDGATGYESLLVTGTDSTRHILASATESLTGLDVGTSYKYQVRAILAVGDTTAWSQVYTFTTKSAAVSFPYVCGFEDDAENTQWRFANSSTNKWYISGSNADAIKSGAKALYISNDGGTTNAYSVSPAAVSYAYRTLDLDAGDYLISFDGKAYGEKSSSGSTIYDYLAAFLVPYHESLTADTYSGSYTAAPANWTPITIDGAMVLAGDANWHQGSAIISIPADTICNLVFMWRNDGSSGNDPAASVDNVRIEKILCMPLTSLSYTDIGSTNASFVWNKTSAESYQAVCLPSGVDLETALATYTLNNLTDTVLTVDTLRSLTAYELHVRAVCEDGEYSAWKSISFTTTDVAVDIPYSTGFEAADDQSWRFIQNNEADHHNWYIGSGAMKDGLSGLYISADGGVNNTTVKAADIVYAVRNFNFAEAGDYTIEFDYKCPGDYYEDYDWDYGYYEYPTAYLNAYIVPGSAQISAGQSAASTWTSMIKEKYDVTDWTHYSGTLQISNPGVYAIAFQWVSVISDYYGSVTAGKTAAAVDNVKVEKVLCSSLREAPVIDGIQSQSATISWTRESDGLHIRLGSSSDITSSSSTNILVDTVIMDATAYLFENLEENQKYYVAVRPVCLIDGERVYSAYWKSLNFSTTCAASNMPYSENFDENVIGTSSTVSCWNRYSGLFNADTIKTSALTSSSYGWSHTTIGGGLEGSHVRMNIWGTTVMNWLVTPSIVINSADANLIFDLALTTYSGADKNTPVTAGRQADDRFIVAVSADNGATWLKANAREWNNTGSVDVYDNIPGDGTTVTMPLGAYNGKTIRIAFYGESTVTGGDNYMHIDNIKVFSGVIVNVEDTVCANTSYSGYGFVISKDNLTPGTTHHNSTFTDVEGVTTLYNLALYVRPEAKAEVTDTACANVPYEKYGFQIASPQSRDYILPTGRLYTDDGCDSTVVLHLYVPQSEYTHKLTLCQSDIPYRFGELDITESGTYIQTLQGVLCDSTVHLEVTVLPTETELRRTICEGESVVIGDQSFNTTGEYRVTLKNAYNCDSTVHLYLTVLGKERYTYTGYLCEGGSYTDKNFSSLTEAGKYTVTHTSVLGCDSIVELDLILAKTQTRTINERICDGEVYTFDGKDLTTTGEYKGTFISSVGCDSIVTLKLQVLPTAEDNQELTLTVNQLPYTFAVTSDSTYIIDKLEEGTQWLEIRIANAAANGCDSVINLTLHIKQPESIDYVSDGVLQIVPNIIERDGTVFIRNTFGATSNEILTVELFDAVGRRVSQKTLSGEDMAVDGFHTSGMYMVRVTDSNKRTYIGQVIVK